MSDTTTFRLTDMRVKEVSAVDRGANKRKFLIVKRDENMGLGSEIKQNPDGSLSTVETKEDGNNADTAPVVDAGTVDTSVDDTDKAKLSLTEDAKTTLMTVLEAVGAKLMEAKAAVESAGMVESEADMQAEPLVKALIECSDLLEDAAYSMGGTEQPMPEGEQPPAPEGEQPPMGKRFDIKRARRLLTEADTGKRGIVKYGSKMKKERLARFQQAMSLLAGIIDELSAEHDTQVSQEQAANRQPQATKVDDTVLKSEVTELRKQVKSLNERLGTARASRVQSNTLHVDGKVQNGSSGFRWPLDMNQSFDRESVTKGEFFGDE
jgi:ribosomal protein L7/L12